VVQANIPVFSSCCVLVISIEANPILGPVEQPPIYASIGQFLAQSPSHFSTARGALSFNRNPPSSFNAVSWFFQESVTTDIVVVCPAFIVNLPLFQT